MLSVAVEKTLPGFRLDAAWEAGEGVVALFGPSGAGKSLTLQCLAGLVRPDAGRIVVDGRVFFDSAARVHLRPQARRLGYVFQGYALFPHLTVEENVGYGLHGRPRRARQQRTREMLERLSLLGLEHRRPHELSGGQQQRVALARALAADPDLLLLDEPLSALDAPLRRQLREELRRIVREWGKTTVLVTHDLAEAFQLADRVVVYDRGRVIQAAPRTELLSQPASEQVARLIGIRNILHGTVESATPSAIRIRWRSHMLQAANAPSLAYLPPAGSAVAFFVQPEHIRLIRKDRPEPEPGRHLNRLAGQVVDELDLGTSWALYIAVEGNGPAAPGYDLEVNVPKLVYEMLGIARDRRWELAIQPAAIQVLPAAEPLAEPPAPLAALHEIR